MTSITSLYTGVSTNNIMQSEHSRTRVNSYAPSPQKTPAAWSPHLRKPALNTDHPSPHPVHAHMLVYTATVAARGGGLLFRFIAFDETLTTKKMQKNNVVSQEPLESFCNPNLRLRKTIRTAHSRVRWRAQHNTTAQRNPCTKVPSPTKKTGQSLYRRGSKEKGVCFRGTPAFLPSGSR